MDRFNFWGSNQEQQKEQPKEDDLTTLLKKDEQGELFRLVGAAMEGMRTTIEANFDTVQTTALPAQLGATTQDANAESPESSSKPQDDASQAMQQGNQDEDSALKLKELKTALLQYFDDWQSSVMLRLGEVMNARDSAERHEGRSAGDQSHGSDVGTDRLKQSVEVDKTVQGLFPPISTSLANIANDKRVLILHSMLLLLLSLEHYTAFSRVLLLHLTSSLKITLGVLEEDEKKVAQGLLEAAKHMSGDEVAKKRAEENKDSRRWKVGIASVAGAALIGVTGGLAAPLVAAGIGGVMGGLGLGATAAAGYLGTLAGSSVLVGGLFGAYGGRMTGKMMDNYAREIEDFAFLPVRGHRKGWSDPHEASPEDRRLRVLIGVSGWLTDKEDVIRPWHVLGDEAEVFALRYELDALLGLGNALTSMVKSTAWGYAKSEIIKRTIFASLTAALWPLGLLKISRIVDNPFSIAKSRSDKAGKVLADALINRAQGERPVTLIGYSLGARVIYSCLMSLAKRKAFGLVESAVLMGAPTPSNSVEWRAMRSVVAGRLVNVYSEHDYILGFLYRTSSIQLGVAGLQKVEGVAHVENVDVSGIVEGHLRYRYLVGSILKRIGFEDIDAAEVQKEEEALQIMDQEEKEKEQEAQPNQNPDAEKEAEKEAEMLESEVQRKNQQTFTKRASPEKTPAAQAS